MAKGGEFVFDVLEEIEVLEEGEKSDTTIELRNVSFANRPPKMDIRRWKHKADEPSYPEKGVQLTDEACERLALALLTQGYGNSKKVRKIIKARAEE